MSSRPSFTKRRKEQARKEKQQAKAERKQQRKLEKQQGTASDLQGSDEQGAVGTQRPAEFPPIDDGTD